MNCKPGDLAIVIRAELPENVGIIVRVLRPARSRHGKGWWVDAQRPRPTTWGKEYRECISPDAWLWPIREAKEDITVKAETAIP